MVYMYSRTAELILWVLAEGAWCGVIAQGGVGAWGGVGALGGIAARGGVGTLGGVDARGDAYALC
jgi:hypothetical protein